jgi:hypothetical protein
VFDQVAAEEVGNGGADGITDEDQADSETALMRREVFEKDDQPESLQGSGANPL